MRFPSQADSLVKYYSHVAEKNSREKNTDAFNIKQI